MKAAIQGLRGLRVVKDKLGQQVTMEELVEQVLPELQGLQGTPGFPARLARVVIWASRAIPEMTEEQVKLALLERLGLPDRPVKFIRVTQEELDQLVASGKLELPDKG